MGRKRFPKIIGIRNKPSYKSPNHDKEPNIRDVDCNKEKNKKDKVYDVIDRACCYGYRFTDNEYGIPFINIEDLEEKENGIYVVRFRCKKIYLHHIFFGSMAEEVCQTLRSGLHFFHESKTEWGLPYEECVWIIQIGEKDIDLPIWRKLFMAETLIKGISPDERPHPRKCTHVRWEEFLQAHYSRSLVSVAQELGYSEQNIDILRCDFANKDEKKRIYNKHKKLFDDFLKDERNKGLMDGRKVYEYFKDLIASWIGEDLLVKALNEYGFTASVANADSDRVIKTNYVGVTGEPDIKIEYEGNTRFLELMDALSPVETYGQFDMRLSKATNQFNRKNIFLLHGLADGKYLLIDFMRENITITYNYPNPRFGNKPCSVIQLQENGIRMYEMALFWESLKDIMRNTKPEPIHHYLKLVDYKTGAAKIFGYDGSDDSDEEPSEESAIEDGSSEAQSECPMPSIQGNKKEQEKDTLISQEDVGSSEDEIETREDTEQEGDDESSIIEDDGNGPSIAYTEEQWAALNDGF